MSRPQNPLNSFRSYSYHHILVACDSTRTAESLAVESRITAFDHLDQERFCPQINDVGRYVVLVNGMTDVQFTIKSAKWSSVFIPNESTGDGPTHYRTMAVDGELEIHEPFGVNFLNLLNEVTKSLGTDANGVVFVLKTIFVGHLDDGTTDTITNIRALTFTMYDVVANFDVTGAQYTIAFVGSTNGAARLPHVSTVGDGFSFNVKPNELLANTMSALTVALNEYYQRQRSKLKKEAECNGVGDVFDEEFIDVKYEIRLDSEYKKPQYRCGSNEIATKLDTGEDDVIIKQGNTMSIENLIDAIMKTSREVLDEDQKEPPKFMYKITSSLLSSPTEYRVIYHIQRFQSAVIPADELQTFSPGENQGIEFDYIFTGRNVDVLDFDLKMNMGMAFFQTLSSGSTMPTNSRNIVNHFNPDPTVPGTGNSEGPGDQNPANENFACENDARNAGLKRRKPLFLGQAIKSFVLRNKRSPGPTTSYEALLMRHAAIENIEANLTIRGNPQLLEETTLLSSDVDPDDPNASEPKAGIIAERRIWEQVHRIPAYVKVNVFMPSAFRVQDSDDLFNADFADNFWYQGWFFAYSIDHEFEDGDFTQRIEMFSQPTDVGQGGMNETSNKSDCNTGDTGDGTNTSDATERTVNSDSS